MRASTRKLTTAAVCTAMAIVMCVFTAYLPLSVMPLYVAAFCFFLACKRGSVAYGALSALATIGLMFLMTGLSVSWFFLVFMFAPYGMIAYFLHKLTYFKVKTGVVRGVIVVGFFNLTLFLVYLVATRVVTVGLDIPVTEWVKRLGGYWAIALIGTALLLPLDFIFSSMSLVVLKKLPGGERPAPPAEQPKYDIFGYEITESEREEHGAAEPDGPDAGGEDGDADGKDGKSGESE